MQKFKIDVRLRDDSLASPPFDPLAPHNWIQSMIEMAMGQLTFGAAGSHPISARRPGIAFSTLV